MRKRRKKRFLLAVWPRTQRKKKRFLLAMRMRIGKKKRFLLAVGMTAPRGGIRGKRLAAKPPTASPHPLNPAVIPSVARNLSPQGARVIPNAVRKLPPQRTQVIPKKARNLKNRPNVVRNLPPQQTQFILRKARNLTKSNKRNDNLQHHSRIQQFYCFRQIHQ